MKSIYTAILTVAVLCLTVSVSASDSLSTPKTHVTDAPANAEAPDTSAPAQLTLTIEELAKYNGKNGKPAYVAVDGIIYDVTGVRVWKNGRHKGQHDAGADLSEQINKKSPHGPRVLKKRPVIGKIVAAPVKK